ncbi:asparagine synthase (glutamine-hydrolyzing) [Paucihalobacter ruber]|uniref:asparagine synthase (glutamine-hydrolyzing) n=1 Tax=Paucihalobacter ruber TaxID=2567861 RepID=A0A506PJP7_9FLAO|nr:asparagine synthase (glutamine-hydrolyzing) [Paucihalobacter ruber]TPV33849.1 asparagine synthase (glutamine-hydrolyzing) [Paucihalobacter ruber]
MCGFLAEYTYTNIQLSNKASFLELLILSKHRGPNNLGYLKGDNYQLGFNRLAIRDTSSKGSQPMLSPSGRYHLLFNGEIYNHNELINNFQLFNLVSTSDTEVIVHLLDKVGFKKTVQSLNGMFAIVVIDTVAQTLLMARDFAGIKPLFYGVSKKGMVAASQFNQVFNHHYFKDNLMLQKEVIMDYFGMGYMQAPNTVFKDIKQVQPGTYIEVSNTGTINISDFKSFGFNKSTGQEFEIDILKQTLKKSVSSQLVSDVPLATFLSGGIDSPLITALAHQTKHDLTAFTIKVEDSKLDESVSASNFATKLNIRHEVHAVNQVDLLKVVDNHFDFLHEPFGDYSSIPTFLITKLASQNFTVMLSGDGGDELFFGYPRMMDIYKKRHWFKIPFASRKPLIRLLNKIGIINTWAPFHHQNLEDWIQSKHCYIDFNRLKRMLPNAQFSHGAKNLYKLPNKLSAKKLLLWLRYNEFYAHLQRVLIKVDRMSMANSVEVRVPFLDKQVIEEALNYVPKHFEKSEHLKKPLKDLLKEFNEAHLENNQKKGFSVPINNWLLNELREDLKTVVFNIPIYGSSFINSSEIKDFVTEFLDGTHQNGWGVWHIYAWQKWAIKNNLLQD